MLPECHLTEEKLIRLVTLTHIILIKKHTKIVFLHKNQYFK